MSWRIRCLLPIINPGTRCVCGDIIDNIGGHGFVCKNKAILAGMRNPMHYALCQSITNVMRPLMSKINMVPMTGEPKLDDFYPKTGPITAANRDNELEGGIDKTRRADIAFIHPGKSHTAILVDCTTKSPLCKGLKDYRPGSVADLATTRKIGTYMSHHNINDISKANIFFFPVESSGSLGKEAKNLCKYLAALDNAPFSISLQRIYQQISVDFQVNLTSRLCYLMKCQRR